MKNIKLLVSLLGILLSFPKNAFSQLEVHDFGKVSMGGWTSPRPSAEAYINSGQSSFTLWIDHNNQTPWSYAVNTVVHDPDNTSYRLEYNGSGNFFVHASGVVWCTGTAIMSDSSVKKDVVKLDNPLDKLKKINGYTYHYKPLKISSGIDKGKTYYPDTLMHMGVLAQEIEQVAPYAIHTSPGGQKAVDYIQLIPLLIESVKKLDAEKQQLSNDLTLLQSRFNKLAESIDTLGGNYSLKPAKTSTDFILYQNSPNPFNSQTLISYKLKGSYSSAIIYIFDLQGTMKKSYTLNSAEGNVTIKSNELNPGMFLYSLVVDGKEIDVKRMLITN